MNKALLSLISISLSLHAFANESNTEIIEVLAPKAELSLATSHQATSFLDDQYRFSLNRTIADRLVALPGVSLNGQGGQFQSYSIRGFSRSRIRTEIDGIPIITDRRAGNSISFIAPDLITQGQVIKGPSSALYGSQALGGVVSLTTQMLDETLVKVGGQFNNDAVNLTIKHQQDALSTAVAYQHGNNDRAANGDDLNTAFERVSGLLKYQVEHPGVTTLFSWLPSYTHDIGKSNIKYPNEEISRYPDEIHSLTQVQFNGDSGWLAKVFHHYQNWDSETIKVEQYQALTEYQSHTLGGQWLAPMSLSELDGYWGLDWLARKGVEINSHYDFFTETADLTENFIANAVTGDEDNFAIYGKINKPWYQANIAVALRYDWIKQQSDSEESITEAKLNGSISLSLPVTPGLIVELDLANGFRYPTLSERYFNGRTPRGFIQGNKALTPETSRGGQLAFSWQKFDQISLRSAVFYYDLDNYIERYRISDDLLSYRNLSAAKITGVEAELKWVLSTHTEHHFSYQQQKGEDNQGQTLADLIPKKLNWTMLMAYGDLSIANAISHRFSQQSVSSSELERKSVTLWDISIDYQLSDKQNIQLAINNINNQTYYGSFDADAALQPERSVRIATSWRF